MLHEQIKDPLFPDCPIRNVLARICGKWPTLVLLSLAEKQRRMRFKEIAEAIPDISQRMLTITLRDLEADGMVQREVFAEVPPRVEYALTDRGRSFLPALGGIVDWAVDNINDILADREDYLQKRVKTALSCLGLF